MWIAAKAGNKNCFLEKDCGKRRTQVKITDNFVERLSIEYGSSPLTCIPIQEQTHEGTEVEV